MALTKLQPANLDAANDFSSLVTSVFAIANSAYVQANTATNDAATAASNYLPTGDYGSVLPATGTLDEETVVRYDLKTEPTSPANFFLVVDLGPL
jgi:hypothetical protein